MDHDLSYRDLFAFPRMVRSTLRLHLPEMAAKLDLSSLERVESVFVTDTGRRRATDVVWRACLKAEPSTWVLLVFDFQSTVDRGMHLRADTYAALSRAEAARQPWGKRPNRVRVAPVVLYNGEDWWWATLTSPPVWTGEEAERVLSYHLVDVGPHGRYDPGWRGAAAAVSHLERARTPEAFAEVFVQLVEDLPSPEEAGLRRAFYRWALRLLAHRGLSVEALSKVEDLTEGLPMIVETMKQWEKDWHRQGHAEGRREGQKEGRREGQKEGHRQGQQQGQKQLLVRQAGTKFGSAVARRLEAVLEGVADPSRTAAISDMVLEHETGDEFMAAVRGTSPRGGRG